VETGQIGEVTDAAGMQRAEAERLRPRATALRARLIPLLDRYQGPRRDFANAVFANANGSLGNPDSAEQAIYNFVKKEKSGSEGTLDAIEATVDEWERQLPEPSKVKRPPRPRKAPKPSRPEAPRASDDWNQLVTPLREELARLEAEEALLQDRLDEVHSTKGRLAKMLRIADTGHAYHQRPGPKKKATSTASPERIETILGFIRAHPNTAVKEISAALGFHKSNVDFAVRRLRESGRIRVAGMGDHNKRLYRVTGDD